MGQCFLWRGYNQESKKAAHDKTIFQFNSPRAHTRARYSQSAPHRYGLVAHLAISGRTRHGDRRCAGFHSASDLWSVRRCLVFILKIAILLLAMPPISDKGGAIPYFVSQLQ